MVRRIDAVRQQPCIGSLNGRSKLCVFQTREAGPDPFFDCQNWGLFAVNWVYEKDEPITPAEFGGFVMAEPVAGVFR